MADAPGVRRTGRREHRIPGVRVSVIIPAFNARRYLPQAIESALGQSHPPAEVIVVDDGSTDDTAQAVTPYQDRIRYARQPNRGVSAARNTGLAMAGGDWVAFLDADDYFLPDKLACQAEILGASPGVTIINSGWRLVDVDGRPIREVEPWREAPVLDLVSWLQWKPVFPGALLIERQALLRAGGFDPGLKHAEDVDLVLRLSRLGCRAAWLRRPTVCYRQHSGNVTRAKLEQTAGILDVLTAFFSQPDLPRAVRRREARVWYSTLLWTAWELFRAGRMGEAENSLRRSLGHTRGGHENAALAWAGAFARFSRRELEAGAESTAIVDLFQRAVAGKAVFPTALATAVRFRLEVVEPYFAGGGLPDDQALAGFRSLNARQVAKTAQGALGTSLATIDSRRIRGFWKGMEAAGLVKRTETREVTTLHLTLFARSVMSGRWSTAAAAGWAALRVGAHPRALPAWWRFLRSAAAFLLRGAGGESDAAIWDGTIRKDWNTGAAPP